MAVAKVFFWIIVAPLAVVIIVFSVNNQTEVTLDLWLEQPSNLLKQVLISGRVIVTDEPGTVRKLTLGDINIPVEIFAPE